MQWKQPSRTQNFIFTHFIITFIKRSVAWLNYTSHIQNRVLKYTAIWNKTMFSKADNYINEGCFQSTSSCGKYTYIGDLYLQKILILLYSLWNTEAAILVKIPLDANFLAFHWQSRFCVNEYIAKIDTKIICNIFSGRFDVHLQVIQPILKFQYLISFIKYPQVRHLK